MAYVYPFDYDAAGAALAEQRQKRLAERQTRKVADVKAAVQKQAERRVVTPRIYAGRRQGARRIVEVLVGSDKARPLDPRHDLVQHSIDEFEWADGHSIPLQLALAILADCLGNRRIALAYYHDFAREIVKDLAWQEWQLTSEEIHDWIVKTTVSELEMTLPPSRRRRRMRLA